MNYYIQGDAANADKINAAFEKLGYDTTGHLFNAKSVLYFTLNGEIRATTCNCTPAIIKTHPDYKELKLPVEPKFKFKVGDWIVQNDNGTVSQITKTINGKDEHGEYRAYEHTNGYFAECFENEYHLWTIQDAKEGDVLAIDNTICIFKKLDKDGYYIISPCIYTVEGVLEIISDENDTIGSCGFKPATKEQRDLLFAKMKEAGYEWDAELKKIKKINEKDMNENEQTNTVRYIDKLICEVEKVLMGLGYKVFVEFNGRTKVWCVELLNANSSEEMPIRHKSMIRGLVKGYLHSFDYSCGTQKIYIYDECKGIHPDDDRYSTLEYAMSKVSDNDKNDLFVNYGTHTERYVIDNDNNSVTEFDEQSSNSPNGYGKYIDDELNKAATRYFAENADPNKYTLADVFYHGYRCGRFLSRVSLQNNQD